MSTDFDRVEEERTRTATAHIDTCSICNLKKLITKRRLNTAYAEDSMNWLESCHDCYLEAVNYYYDLWSEYYSNVWW